MEDTIMTFFEAKEKARADKNLCIIRRVIGPTEFFGVMHKDADINNDSNIQYK